MSGRLSKTVVGSLFVLLATHSASAVEVATADFTYTPPTCSAGPFTDVGSGHPACAWIQRLAADQISTGCGGGKYCPDGAVTRAQLAVILEKALRGTANWDLSKGMWSRTRVVPIVPGNQVASGARLLATIVSIDDSSVNNVYHVLLEGGTYDLDGAQLVLPEGLVLEGIGRNRTKIRTARSGAAVVGGFSELHSLEVGNFLPGASVHGVDAPVTLKDVTVRASGAVTVGIYCDELCALDDVFVDAGATSTATGVYLHDEAFDHFKNVQISASAGSIAYGLRLDGLAAGEVLGGDIEARSGDTLVVAVQVDSANSAFLPLLLRNVTAEATSINGPTIIAGLRVLHGDTVVENSRISGDGNASSDDYGVLCEEDYTQIHNSRIIGDDHTLRADTGCTLRAAASQLYGGATFENGGAIRCVADYSEAFGSNGLEVCF